MRSNKVKAILDKRVLIKSGDNTGKHPVKVKVNFTLPSGGYTVKRFQVQDSEGNGIYCKVKEFPKVKASIPVVVAVGKAGQLTGKGYSPEVFERLFTSSGGLDEIKYVFDLLIKQLREEGRDGTADSYRDAYNSFKTFKGDSITFASITKEWLMAYERAMKKKGRSANTIGMYTRALKAVFNYAVDPLKLISLDLSPFGRRKFIPPTGQRKEKKAHTREDISKLLNFESSEAVDYWCFQYLASGCNMADVAYLQYKNISFEDEFITFDRKKTENTERDKKPIEVFICDRILTTIKKYGQRENSLNPEAYVFPILSEGLTSRQRKEKIRLFRKHVNAGLKDVQEKLKLTIRPKCETARYSAATELKRNGIELKIIGKAMGHGSEATTEHYTEEGREIQKMVSRLLSG